MRTPKYCRHKATGQGYARVAGKCVYLGPWNTEDSKERYRRLLIELLEGGGKRPQRPASPATVREAVDGYLAAMRAEWGEGEKGDRHLVRLRHALDVVTGLFGSTPLAGFGVGQLETVRGEMVRRDWSRKHVNEQVNVVRRCWRWLTLRGHTPPGVTERMAALEHLRAGRCQAREAERREPPSAEVLARVLARLSRTNPLVAALVRVQLLSGARTGELLSLTPGQLDRSGEVWVYRPRQHKNLHRGKGRAVPLPPEAVGHLLPLLEGLADGDVVFSPRRAVLLRPRTTAHPPGWRSRPGGPGPRPPAERYTSYTYAQCVGRACRAEGVEPFRPYALRHLAITRWAETLGVEEARLLAGHSTARMTSHYVHTDAAKVAALLAPKKEAG